MRTCNCAFVWGVDLVSRRKGGKVLGSMFGTKIEGGAEG